MKIPLAATALSLASALTGNAALIGYWNLDEASGAWADSAGPTATNGTNSGAVAYRAATVPAGTYGSITVSPTTSAFFDAGIDVPFNASVFLGSAVASDLNVTGDFTVMAWVQPTVVTGNHMYFATGAGGENGWKVGYNGNQLRFTANGVIDVTAPAANFTVVADTWYHMAASVEGTAGTRTVRFYVNGDEVYNTTFANIATSTSPNMMIGNNGQEDPGTPGGASFNENFDGNIDEIRLYDTVLTRNEIIAAAAPVPEPAGVALIVAASAAVALRRRSKRG